MNTPQINRLIKRLTNSMCIGSLMRIDICKKEENKVEISKQKRWAVMQSHRKLLDVVKGTGLCDLHDQSLSAWYLELRHWWSITAG
jgi:hypothetical protein